MSDADQAFLRPGRVRESRFERQMSGAEALMWNIEKDPWLNPNAASLAIFDRPVDFEDLRQRLAYAVSEVPRLRERVVARLGRMVPPVWVTDPDFDLDFHVRRIGLPEPGSRRQLLDLAARVQEEPFDRTRPLWWFVVVDGLRDGRGALIWKSHHAVADGIGLVRLSEQFMQIGPDDPLPPEVDLEQVVAEGVAADHDAGLGVEGTSGFFRSAAGAVGHLAKRETSIARRAVGEMSLWYADPLRVRDTARHVVGAVRSTVGDFSVGGGERSGASLWSERSRRRRLEVTRTPLAAVKAAGKALGGSVNDVFVTAIVEAAANYHQARGAPVESFDITFIVSTRTDDAVGGNSFTPARVRVPAGVMPVEERLVAVRDAMAARREKLEGPGALAGIAGLANLLPTSVVTGFARDQAAGVDFATSNLRAAPFAVWVSGALLEEMYPIGPVAGTAFNLTTLSYNGSLDIGMFLDPAAVHEPDALVEALDDAYARIYEAAGVDPAQH